jgi:glycosyltransferase involved in cell wall biosynthesis
MTTNKLLYKSKKGLIIVNDNYPLGSWSNRTRHWINGFKNNNIETKLIVTHPFPSIKNINASEEFVTFINKPSNKNKIISFINSTWKTYKYIKKQNGISFILYAGGSFLSCYLVKKYCDRKKINFLIEIVDENSKKFSETKLSLVDRLAKFNKELFDKYLISKLNTLFVLSSYLEKKYKLKHSNISIIRTVPSIINIKNYDINKSKKIESSYSDFFQSEKINFFYAGSCVRTNGIFFFLECIKQVLKHTKKINIILIFHLGDQDRVYDYIKELKLDNYIKILPGVLPDFLPALYQKADILFLPEHGNIIANAGFPGKTAELLASGKPVICTDFSDLSNFITNGINGFISPIGDHETYIENLLKMIESKALRTKVGKMGRKTALEQFDHIEAVKKYIPFL